MPNLYGDILSDVAAQIAGSIGLAGSSNIGDHVAMFEAVHGSAPDIAGKDIANPSGLIQAAAMLLAHIGQGDIATRVQNAWLRTIEDGVHTADVAGPHTREKVGTRAFAQAVIARLGQAPAKLKPVQFAASQGKPAPVQSRAPAHKALVGVDVFLHWREGDAETLGAALNTAATGKLGLKMITNRGVKVWPGGLPETLCTDHWRCRFMPAAADATVTHANVVALLGTLAAAGFDFIKTEHLCTFDGVPGYSLGQGQ